MPGKRAEQPALRLRQAKPFAREAVELLRILPGDIGDEEAKAADERGFHLHDDYIYVY